MLVTRLESRAKSVDFGSTVGTWGFPAPKGSRLTSSSPERQVQVQAQALHRRVCEYKLAVMQLPRVKHPAMTLPRELCHQYPATLAQMAIRDLKWPFEAFKWQLETSNGHSKPSNGNSRPQMAIRGLQMAIRDLKLPFEAFKCQLETSNDHSKPSNGNSRPQMVIRGLPRLAGY